MDYYFIDKNRMRKMKGENWLFLMVNANRQTNINKYSIYRIKKKVLLQCYCSIFKGYLLIYHHYNNLYVRFFP